MTFRSIFIKHKLSTIVLALVLFASTKTISSDQIKIEKQKATKILTDEDFDFSQFYKNLERLKEIVKQVKKRIEEKKKQNI